MGQRRFRFTFLRKRCARPFAWRRIISTVFASRLPFGALAILHQFGPTQVFVAAAVIITITCLDLAVLGPRTNGRSLEAVTGTGDRATAEPVTQRGA